jgi:hypothetical protein
MRCSVVDRFVVIASQKLLDDFNDFINLSIAEEIQIFFFFLLFEFPYFF